MHPALALLEFDSIAAGIMAGDAMAKRAPIAKLLAGTVQPGKYLVLVTGAVADVEESVSAGRSAGSDALLDYVLLPGVHPDVVSVLVERLPYPAAESLGVVETRGVAAAIIAADAGVKGADVRLVEIRLADGLGGRGLVLFAGSVANVEAAVICGTDAIASTPALVHAVVIPQLHAEMVANLEAGSRWQARVAALGETGPHPG